jgi:hypothetical protein
LNYSEYKFLYILQGLNFMVKYVVIKACSKCGGTDYKSLTWFHNHPYGDCCLSKAIIEDRLKRQNSLEKFVGSVPVTCAFGGSL